jgi:hypothetical protein
MPNSIIGKSKCKLYMTTNILENAKIVSRNGKGEFTTRGSIEDAVTYIKSIMASS